LPSPYYQYLPKRESLPARAAEHARRKMFLIFMRELAPVLNDTILDVGVTSNETYRLDNYFEVLYPHKDRITAVGLEDGSHLEARYPGIKFVQVSPGPLPFRDRHFDYVHSSAVLEHVGSGANQSMFLRELWRVARKGIFVTTPNRWFPIEVHTVLPLVHWLPWPIFRRALTVMGKSFLASEENLNLLGKSDLAGAAREAGIESFQIDSVLILGWPSNLLLIARKHYPDILPIT
jgi:hypothetical protein